MTAHTHRGRRVGGYGGLKGREGKRKVKEDENMQEKTLWQIYLLTAACGGMQAEVLYIY